MKSHGGVLQVNEIFYAYRFSLYVSKVVRNVSLKLTNDWKPSLLLFEAAIYFMVWIRLCSMCGPKLACWMRFALDQRKILNFKQHMQNEWWRQTINVPISITFASWYIHLSVICLHFLQIYSCCIVFQNAISSWSKLSLHLAQLDQL